MYDVAPSGTNAPNHCPAAGHRPPKRRPRRALAGAGAVLALVVGFLAVSVGIVIAEKSPDWK